MSRFVFIAVAVLVLFSGAACTTLSPLPQSEAPEVDLMAVIASLPGKHTALTANAPEGYEPATPAFIYAQHKAGEDIWLYVDSQDLSNMDANGQLLAWLNAIRAVRFPLLDAVIYWIPADPEVDRLAFAEANALVDFIEPAQQAQLWRERGDQLRSRNAFEEAIQAYQHALTLPSHDAEVFAGLGAAYLGLGKNEEAAQAFQAALEISPDHYWARRLLGNAYLKLQRYALAADELTQAYILNPADPHLLIGIALGQGRSGHPDLALLTLDQLLARTDDAALLADAEVLRREFLATSP